MPLADVEVELAYHDPAGSRTELPLPSVLSIKADDDHHYTVTTWPDDDDTDDHHKHADA